MNMMEYKLADTANQIHLFIARKGNIHPHQLFYVRPKFRSQGNSENESDRLCTHDLSIDACAFYSLSILYLYSNFM